MWELDCKESWALKNWCFWTMVLEKTIESPLDCKEIQPVHPKGDQSWIFILRTDAEAEIPILWPSDAKNWLTGKDPVLGKIEGRRRRRWPRMRWLDGITDSMHMTFSELAMVNDSIKLCLCDKTSIDTTEQGLQSLWVDGHIDVLGRWDTREGREPLSHFSPPHSLFPMHLFYLAIPELYIFWNTSEYLSVFPCSVDSCSELSSLRSFKGTPEFVVAGCLIPYVRLLCEVGCILWDWTLEPMQSDNSE